MTRVIILAAGQGTRLRPLSDDKPKCMVEFNSKPLIKYQLEVFEQAGIKDVNFVSGYAAEKLPDSYRKFHNEKFDSTNMVSSLFCASQLMDGDKDLVIAYGDIIYDISVLEALLQSDSPINIVTDLKWNNIWSSRMSDVLADAETFKWDVVTKKITELGKKPKSINDIQGQYIGLIKIRKDYHNHIINIYNSMDRNSSYDGKDFNNMYMTSFIQYIIDIGEDVHGVPIHNNWLEFDSIDDINAYQEELKQGKLKWIS